jgi:cytoplasmic tRNA 2-thiolation protein 1
MPRLCVSCKVGKAILKRPKTGEMICNTCFFSKFEEEIHQTIVSNKLFSRGDKVAIAASGGKGSSDALIQFWQYLDSTVLAEVMSILNKRYDYGLELFLLSVDEGITGYRDDSLEVYNFNISLLSYNNLL